MGRQLFEESFALPVPIANEEDARPGTLVLSAPPWYGNT
jgi:hypothetical protein